MKSELPDIPSRIDIKRVRVNGVVSYDADNGYAQRMDRIADGSPRLLQCLAKYAKHIRGEGFNQLNFALAKVNNKGLTADKLLRKITADFARIGFALHVRYNGLAQVSEVTPIPFKEIRLPDKKKMERWKINGKVSAYPVVLHHPDWTGEVTAFKASDIQVYYRFNPDQEVVYSQINECGGIVNFTGQILYYHRGIEDEYVTSTFDSVQKDALAEAEFQDFRLSSAMNGFMNLSFVVTDEFTDAQEEKGFQQKLVNFQGGRAAGRLWHVQRKPGEEQTLEVKPIENKLDDKIFAYSESAVNENIRKNYNQPAVLLGDRLQNQLAPTKEERRNAHLGYNAETRDERIQIEEVIKSVFSRFYFDINPGGDYSIKELDFDKEDSSLTLSEKLGESGRRTFLEIMSSTVYTKAQKVMMLIDMFKYNEQRAKELVYATDELTDPIN